MYILTLKKGEEKRLLAGHPWVFANEVAKIEGKDKQGSIAKVLSHDGRFIGLGYINHKSKIIVRLLTDREEETGRQFFYDRIKRANDEKLALGFTDNYRAVFAESDLLPALIVDRYGDYLSVQFLSLGMEVRKQLITDILVEIFAPKGIYERSDASVREAEGLEKAKGVLYGEVPDRVIITENGVKLYVDIKNGQKTGYFLDQKENRAAAARYARGKNVLDCFCNAGGFSLCAAAAGAKSVIAADISRAATELVEANAELNGFDNIRTVTADVFDLLRKYKAEKKRFDVIVLDPPAFTKSRDTVMQGYRGYRDINALAFKLLERGGFLITCSCSQHLSVKQFTDMIKESAGSYPVKIVELRIQSRDHATLAAMEESLYLKVAVLEKL